MNFRFISKIGLLLVVIGFFMPVIRFFISVAFNRNGLEIASFMVNNKHVIEGFLVYILLISAIIGVLIGALLLINKRLASGIDWLVIIVCIASGLIVYLGSLKQIQSLQTGAYLILTGWIIAFGGQLLSMLKRE